MSELNQEEAQFVLQRIYVKDMSFESPKAPDSFLQQFKPKINLELNSSHRSIDEENFEVTLSVTVTANNEADEVIYLVEVQQAGVFMISGMEDEGRTQTLGSYCPSVLFPYAREAIDNLVSKGSFPPLMLAPVNFDAVYAQAKAQAEAQSNSIQ
ncbi:MAG: protein-export chaperone SecB [Gammaproteobacteria bacterium]|nr:protein-export chaperone SecB [Gammaproteobacteria bacterium]